MLKSEIRQRRDAESLKDIPIFAIGASAKKGFIKLFKKLVNIKKHRDPNHGLETENLNNETNKDNELFGFGDSYYTKLTDHRLEEYTYVRGANGWFSVLSAWYNLDRWMHSATKQDIKDFNKFIDKVEENYTKNSKLLPKYKKIPNSEVPDFVKSESEYKEWIEGFQWSHENVMDGLKDMVFKSNSPSKTDIENTSKRMLALSNKILNTIKKNIIKSKEDLTK